ncbi:hypothetical protein AALA22_15360 [Anaerovoracaceae bacterium 41-7]
MNEKKCELQVSNQKAMVVFSDKALLKMLSAISICTKEIGWHGEVTKIDTGIYEIQEVFLYPQIVDNTTIVCEKDGLEYGKWQQDLIVNNPKRADSLAFHGHSHVNMACFPSNVDKDLQEDLIEMLPDDRFYIFLIVNKSLKQWWRVVDKEDGVLYTNALIVNNCLQEIVIEYDELVKINTEVENGF